jgi:hypothetical protein
VPTFNQLASDNFNRTDAADLGANWDSGYTGYDAFQIDEQFAAADPAGTTKAETYNAITWPDNQYVLLTIGAIQTENYGGPILRAANPATASWYEFGHVKFGATVGTEIYKNISGTATLLIDDTTTWATSDTLRAYVIGTDIYLDRNGVLLLSTSDSALSSGRGGMVGLWFDGGTGGLLRFDNWSGGEAVADGGGGGGSLPHHLMLLGVGR